MWGILSNHSLNQSDYYDSDVIIHGANYGAGGSVEGASLYRTMASLPDTRQMDGNCKDAQKGIGRNEFYPCIQTERDFGWAITGIEYSTTDRNAAVIQRVSLDVDRYDEPDLRQAAAPAALKATLTVHAPLAKGGHYRIMRWDDYHRVPTRSSSTNTNTNTAGAGFDSSHDFVASDDGPHIYQDPIPVLSNGTSYYRCMHIR